MKKNNITEMYLINNNLPDGIKASQIKTGSLVKRKPGAKGVYILEGYDRSEKKYILNDMEDISRNVYVKASTKLFLKFDY